MKIFLDLDGVLVDFDKAYGALSGKKHSVRYEVDWKLVNEAGADWWASMPWKADGKRLWTALKPFNPTILSSPSRHEDSRKGKRIWVARELGEDVPLILETKKERYAGSDRILIDDRPDNIEKWVDKGGIGILHTDTESTLKKISDLALKP